ncbi:MMPL family transporter [soil metagenome]
MLKSLAQICYRKRRIVLGSWIVLVVGLIILSSVAGGTFRTEFSIPGSESQEAIDILAKHGFASRTGSQAQIVFESSQGFDDPAIVAPIETLLATIEGQVPNTSVSSPFDPEGARQISQNGTIAYAEVNLSERSQEEYLEAGETIREISEPSQSPALRIELGGDMFLEEAAFSSEAIGFLAAVVILLIAFGSVLAMGLPIATALFGIGSGIALVGVATQFMDLPNFTTPAVGMIGIGVGIDYALFIVTRYRQGLHDGLTPEEAVVLAINTSGRAVLFAGTTVVIAVLGLVLMNLRAISGLAVAIALGVLMTMLASVTLLPALLGFVGNKIDKFGLPHHKQAEGATTSSFWHGWSRFLQRRPWPAVIAALVILLMLSVPVLDLRLGFGDAGNRPDEDTSRQAYDLLSEGFGSGSNGPLVLAAELPGGEGDFAVLQQLSADLNQTPGVAFAAPPQLNPEGDAAIMMVLPTTSPQDEATTDLVHHLRDEVVPASTAGSTANVKVGGATAAATDFSEYTLQQLPIFFVAVLVLSFLLLMAIFRSLLVPLKAVIMNLLSVGAAYGVLVAVFQWGWGLSLVGGGKEGPVEAWVPMMLFAIIFGLSMNYEVFLLSRIREEYDRIGDNARAVADGLAATARVITAAAAIMVCVFGSFVLGVDRSLKIMGFGLATAVLVDATIVRLVLVPATMELLGDKNWWIPRWLDRILPRIHVEAAPVAGVVPQPDHVRVTAP